MQDQGPIVLLNFDLQKSQIAICSQKPKNNKTTLESHTYQCRHTQKRDENRFSPPFSPHKINSMSSLPIWYINLEKRIEFSNYPLQARFLSNLLLVRVPSDSLSEEICYLKEDYITKYDLNNFTLKLFYWDIIDIQYLIGFRCTS